MAISLLGTIIIVLVKAAQDIAKRKRAEDEMRKARDVHEQRVKDRTTEGVIRASNGKEGGAVFTVEIPLEYSSEGTG